MSKYEVNGFIFPNSIVDELLCELSHAELKCYLVVVRKTKGWNKDEDSISVTQFMKVTGLSNRSVVTACDSLVKRGLLERRTGERNTGIYSVKTFNSATSEKTSLVKNFPATSEKTSLDLVKKVHTQNNNINTTIQNKKLNKKNPSDENFAACFENFWQAGMVKNNKSIALKKFKAAYAHANAENSIELEDFTAMLVADVRKRIGLQQFGFDKLHPATYLNNQRWLDDYQQMQTVNVPKNPPLNHYSNWAAGRTIEVPEGFTWESVGLSDEC